MLSFSQELISSADLLIEKQVNKAFLNEIKDGTLPNTVFQYWLKVDYPYLTNYARILGLAIARAENLRQMADILNLLEGTLEEMELHKKYATRFNVSLSDLENAKMGPLKHAYAKHEMASAYSGSLGELLSALLPCAWNYGAVVRKLVKITPISPDNRYKDWLSTYSAEEFAKLGATFSSLIDEIANKSTTEQLSSMKSSFTVSMNYELYCWDEYYAMTEWEF